MNTGAIGLCGVAMSSQLRAAHDQEIFSAENIG
jgi:hypothetical protein